MALKNLVGQKFGRLTVIARAENKGKRREACWLCKCDCGNEVVVVGSRLTSGETKSCGCLKHEPTNRAPMEGKTFGRLTVLSYDHTEGKTAFYRCRCDCGNEVVVRGGDLRSGNTQSCGCLRKENLNRTTHGMRHSKIYNTWRNIKARCYNPKSINYKDYGGRNIAMYAPWINDFQAFYDYISALEYFGEDGFSLDRIEVNGNYEPGNLRWADAKTQQRNRSNNIIIEYNGERMTLTEAAEHSGVNMATLWARYHAGNRGERLFRPVRGSK